jgi:hypothetical protein
VLDEDDMLGVGVGVGVDEEDEFCVVVDSFVMLK